MAADRYVIVGSNGALGHDLLEMGRRVVPAYRGDFDIRDGAATRAFLKDANPTHVINTAAYHQVPQCETDFDRALDVNVVGVRQLAIICQELGIHLCHISTDYVFDGKKGAPYLESDCPLPLSAYAISKVAGEHAVAAYCSDYTIVRSCGLYGRIPTRAKGGNFITNMIHLGSERDRVQVVDDEIVTPTYTRDLAEGIFKLLEKKGKGIFHVTQEGETNWFEFAKVIFETLNLNATLESTKAAKFQSVVKRPMKSTLDNSRFIKLTGKGLRHWRLALLAYLADVHIVKG